VAGVDLRGTSSEPPERLNSGGSLRSAPGTQVRCSSNLELLKLVLVRFGERGALAPWFARSWLLRGDTCRSSGRWIPTGGGNRYLVVDQSGA